MLVSAGLRKDAPATVLRLFLISHEPMQIRTVKSVVIYDAVVRSGTYPSTLTNKEETFVTLRYTLSATECPGAGLSGVLRCLINVLHRLHRLPHRLHRFI